MTLRSVGITASRHGLSEHQRRALTAFLHRARLAGATRFHHGCCVGGDEIGAMIAHNLGYWVMGDLLDEFHDKIDVLIGLPDAAEDDPASAESQTWVNVRYARLVSRPRLVMLPAGQVVDRVGVDDLHVATRGEYAAGPVSTDSLIGTSDNSA